MEKFIPYEKLSKKQQRERNKLRRGSWGAVNPVTRKPANPKAYNRQKARRWKYDPPDVPSVSVYQLFFVFAGGKTRRFMV